MTVQTLPQIIEYFQNQGYTFGVPRVITHNSSFGSCFCYNKSYDKSNFKDGERIDQLFSTDVKIIQNKGSSAILSTVSSSRDSQNSKEGNNRRPLFGEMVPLVSLPAHTGAPITLVGLPRTPG